MKTDIPPRATCLSNARRSIRLARCLARDRIGFVNGAWLNAMAFRHAIESALVWRTMARSPGRGFADVAYELFWRDS